MKPLVSVITPTWDRHELLLSRCIPSVQAQSYPNIEHIIVSDGPDPALREKLAGLTLRALDPLIVYLELPERVPARWGCRPRRHGLAKARGELITYIDDDDRLFPKHCEVLVEAFCDPSVMWAHSEMLSHSPAGEIIIAGPPEVNQIGTPMVMHRPELLQVATWGEPSATEDWELFRQWLAAGHEPVKVDAVTSEVWPSVYR